MSPAHRKYCDPTKMPTKDPDLIVDERLMETGFKSWTTCEIGKRERERETKEET